MHKNVYIVDIDGTVAYRNPNLDGGERSPFDYNLVHTDLPNLDVIQVIKSLWESGSKLVFVTGRDDICFNQTYRWLVEHCPPFVKLYMRKNGDMRPDEVVKREIYDKHIKFDYNVVGVFDDRNKVVKMWRELGLTCFQVAEGDF